MEDQEQNIYYVYLHRRCDTNDVFYVGKGKGKRAYQKYSRNRWWCAIVEKVGFTVEMVEINLAEDDAFELEVETIKFYKECGYTLCNMTNGGEGQSGVIASAETRAKQSAARMGNTHGLGHRDTDEQRKKKSLSRIGKKHSQETLDKIGNSHKKPVVCSNGMWFDSTRAAIKWLKSIGFLKAAPAAIGRCCHGTAHIAYGFKWSFATEINKSVEEILERYGVAYSEPEMDYVEYDEKLCA